MSEKQMITKMYCEEGMSQSEIAKELGYTQSGISRKMGRLGIETEGDDEILGTLEERFWDKVDKGKSDECWEWEGATVPGGYGVISVYSEYTIATHVIWFFEEDEWPDKMMLHHCDNPSCVNPKHLYEGDYSDNMQDSISRGRAAIEEEHPMAKIDMEEAKEIKSRLNNDEDVNSIADDYPITVYTVIAIRQGRCWKNA